jgi:hypothetical protein
LDIINNARAQCIDETPAAAKPMLTIVETIDPLQQTRRIFDIGFGHWHSAIGTASQVAIRILWRGFSSPHGGHIIDKSLLFGVQGDNRSDFIALNLLDALPKQG